MAMSAWAIVAATVADPDPSPAAEASAYKDGRSPGEVSLNHVRPQAIGIAVAFALWARRRG